MKPINLNWAAELLNARMIGNANGAATSVCTDTRRLQPGALFFALQGEQADGHRYVAQAFDQGAGAAVVSREVEGVSGPMLLVPDTTQSLGDLAMHYRRQFDIPVVGITGSVGKTSTKEMTAAVLRTRYKTLANEKNYNTEIGVPLTLFQLDHAHEVAVIEVGMRGPGQIDRLAEIAQPTIGAITNIGYTHMELLGSQQNIARAKSELLTHLPEGGTAVLPRHDAFFEYLQSRVPPGRRCLTFSILNGMAADVVVQEMQTGACQGTQPTFDVTVHGRTYTLPMRAVGVHHGANAAAALAIACALDIAIPDAIAALEQWEGAEGRMVVRKTATGLTILDDCYNASTESMDAALRTLKGVAQPHPAVAVLGDMRELGEFAAEAHRRVGEMAARTSLRLLVTVGDLAQQIGTTAARDREPDSQVQMDVRHYADSDEAAAHIGELVGPDDTVLVKGSRAMEMEKIVAALTGEQDTRSHD